MTINESINRGFNLLGNSVIALAGFAFASEIFLEKDWDDKADDIALLVLAVFGIVWYLMGNNKFKRSIEPMVVTILALIIKIFAVIREFSDKEAAGDDFGGVTLFLMTAVLVIFQFYKTKKLLQQNPA